MTETEFRAALGEAGYTTIEDKTLDAKPANAQHAHDHDVRGLVLSGTFTVWTGAQSKPHRPGEIFFVPAGIEHSEEIGAGGAHVVIGRRWRSD